MTLQARKSRSSPLLTLPPNPPPYTPPTSTADDDDDEDTETDVIYTRPKYAMASPLSPETETETEVPTRRPPLRKAKRNRREISRLTSYLFEFSRWLAVVPAMFGVAYNTIFLVFPSPTSTPRRPSPTDHAVAILWACLTGYQALAMTTGLLARWRIYYPPLPTLIRLLALQLAICWPLVHLTCSILNASFRPEVAWAVIGTSTSISRAVQIWVTSNLWWEDDGGGKRWRGGRWGGRRWDWGEVSEKCAVPVGALYFMMAWAEVIRRELEGTR
jgi:hypothetical protein